jgi:archaellum component FlaF (FlaF/FlaG flagellin family)
MGFSVIAAAAMLGLTLFMAVEIITNDLLPTIDELNKSYGDMKDRYQSQLQSDINITSVTRSLNGSNYDYNITVKNTGSVTLVTKNFQILINGTIYPFTCSVEKLYPEETVFFFIMNVTGTGTQRVKVTTNNGIAEYYTTAG